MRGVRRKVKDGNHQCPKCETYKPLTEFHIESTGKPSSYCRPCKKEYLATWYASQNSEKKEHEKARKKAIRIANKTYAINKFGNKCNDCGNSFPMCVYDFHHTEEHNKEIEVGRLTGYGSERFKQELAKCIMLCSNCHRIRHFESSSRL